MTDFGLDPHIIEQIQTVLSRHPLVQSAGIFGSRGRGDYKNYSDIDLAVHAPGMSFEEFLDVVVDIKRLPIIFKFDIVHADSCAKPELRTSIEREEKPIYVKERT